MNDKKRLQLPPLGIYYADLLKLDSSLNDRSVPQQAQSLLCAKLQEREERIKERLAYTAHRLNMSTEELTKMILNEDYKISD